MMKQGKPACYTVFAKVFGCQQGIRWIGERSHFAVDLRHHVRIEVFGAGIIKKAIFIGDYRGGCGVPPQKIVTGDEAAARRFLMEVDAAAVFHNASTRLHDGGVFGFGSEIGISTQKLHARGTMGVKELTTTKYVIYGHGEIRE